MKANLSGSSVCGLLLLGVFVSLAPIQSGRAQGSNSPPALAIEVSLPRIRLQWPTRPDVVYEVQRSRRLVEADWLDLCGSMIGDGATRLVLDVDNGEASSFYRLVLPEVPVVRASTWGDRNAQTLNAILHAYGSERLVLLLDNGNWSINTTVVVGHDKTLCIGAGTILDGEGELSFDGGFLADTTNRVFDRALRVAGLTRPVRPEWWGFSPQSPAATNAAALRNAVRAASRTVVELPEGVFAIGYVSLWPTNVVIQGQSAGRYDTATRRLTDGTRLIGSLRLGGESYRLRALSVEFGTGSGDPLIFAGGANGRLEDLTVLGASNNTKNAHNVFVAGANVTAMRIGTYGSWGHGFVSKSAGLRAESITAHNCRYGVTVKSGCPGDPSVSDNVLRNVTVTADDQTGRYGLIVMACGLDMTSVDISGLRVSDLYMGVNLEASGGARMDGLTIDGALVEGCSYGYRSYMSSPAVMSNVTLSACEARACSVGFFQQAPGVWVDVVGSSAVNCTTPVSGRFRTADILLVE